VAKNRFDLEQCDIAWCPGCGNHALLAALKQALIELDIRSENLVMVSGIGQAAKTPHYLKANVFNGLHGRALPPATAIKAVNPALVVIAESGDGDMYGEGGNHFMHAIRRNPDLTNIVHNNMVYGLTKGQASPTSQKNFITPLQVEGVILEPFNPMAVAVALNASFVARAFTGDAEQTKDILKKAIVHKGYALVDVFQPCLTFNKINTFKWFKEHIYYVDDSYDPTDRRAAFAKALEQDKFPLGILYKDESRPVFAAQLPAYHDDATPVCQREFNQSAFDKLLAAKKE
jgi:2-oxoglutarate/2-oxoacid ferredoxin oxidoreductase subunit beta